MIESAYRIEDHTVPVGGGSITVRSLIPTPQGVGEDETFPLLFWMHGGGMEFTQLGSTGLTHFRHLQGSRLVQSTWMTTTFDGFASIDRFLF